MEAIRKLNADEIEAKVKTIGEKGVQILLYKTARTDRQILDEVFGAMNWTSDYKEIKGNLYCGIGCRETPESPFVWKWDCGVESREDGDGNEKKGEASDSFKRAGFQWGIGVELYTSPFIWASVPTKAAVGQDGKLILRNGKKIWLLENPYERFSVAEISYDTNGKIANLVITDSKGKVVFTTKKDKKGKDDSDFKKDAVAQKKATTKAIRQAIDEGKEYTKPTPQKPLKERFDNAMQWLKSQTPETYRSAAKSYKDAINALYKELHDKGVAGWYEAMSKEFDRVTSIDDEIKY